MLDDRREIMQNVYLTYLPANKFKTCLLSAQLIAPLAPETASYNALLPAVLRRGTTSRKMVRGSSSIPDSVTDISSIIWNSWRRNPNPWIW